MNLLPKTSIEFSSKEYWNEFFSKRGSNAFEWYGEYAELCGYLHKYIKPSDKILVAGCGSSSLSADLYKAKYRDIINIDISEVVIRQMKAKYVDKCSEMLWVHGNLFNLQYKPESFSCILDKGTLDALMSEKDEDKAASQAQLYFQELGRVLRIGGRYFCISLLQGHILTALLDWFPANGWFMRFCRCADAERERESFQLPVFIIVCTKLKMLPNFQPVIELNLQGDEVKKVSAEETRDSVTSLQEFSWLKHNLNTKVCTGEPVVCDLYEAKTDKKRYSLFVVDSPPRSKNLPFAVFIVPNGRETEWLFKTPKGQLQLAESASTKRLIVVHLMRDQIYDTMMEVQNELSSKVIELSPAKLPKNYKIPFLSVGGDLGERKELFRGTSTFSGDFIVEEVKDEDANCTFRRLIFLNNPKLIQSEAKLILEKVKKRFRQVIDPAYLACAHHSVMLISLQFTTDKIDLLLIGLGGGALATFIHKYFSQVNLTCVDIDEAIVNVAKNWFNFKPDWRLRCEVKDGLDFISDAAKKEIKYDLIMFDVDSKELSEGLSCPPKQFLEREFLDKVSSCISDSGIFTVNLVCRDKQLKGQIIEDIRSVFSSILCVQIPEEVNVVLFCQRESNSTTSMEDFEKKVVNLKLYLKSKIKRNFNFLESNEIMTRFKIL